MASDYNERPVEKLNLKEIPLSSFIQMVALAFQSRQAKYDENGNSRGDEYKAMERPILAIGKPGIGKTEIMRSVLMQRFKLPKESIVELRLGSMQDTDIIGMPAIKWNGDEPTTKFAQLDVLPRKETHPPYGILILDELTTCNAAVRSVALQLLDSSRGVGQYKLPNGWMIVALGNGPDDGADYSELKSTIISRCAGFYVTVDFALWREWAVSNGVHDAVVGFLTQNNGNYLYSVEGRGEYDSQIVTPRTWETTSDMLHVAERFSPGNKIPSDLVEAVCSSGIGQHMGVMFTSFYKSHEDLIPIEQIVSGQAIKGDPSQVSVEAMFLGQQMIAEAIVNRGLKYKDFINQVGRDVRKYMREKGFDSCIADEDMKAMVNILEFICWYGSVNLTWALYTFETITTVANSKGLMLDRYLALPTNRIRTLSPSYSAFLAEQGKFAKKLKER